MALKDAAEKVFNGNNPTFTELKNYMQSLVDQLTDIGFSDKGDSHVVTLGDDSEYALDDVLGTMAIIGRAIPDSRESAKNVATVIGPCFTACFFTTNTNGATINAQFGQGRKSDYSNGETYISLTDIRREDLTFGWNETDLLEETLVKWVMDSARPEIADRLKPPADSKKADLSRAPG